MAYTGRKCARSYWRRSSFSYLAAANRGRYVVENFPQSPAVPDALAVMVQAYQLLSLNELASSSLAVLKENFPDHPSIDDNGQFKSEFAISDTQRTWLNKASFGLLDHTEPPKFDNRADYLIR